MFFHIDADGLCLFCLMKSSDRTLILYMKSQGSLMSSQFKGGGWINIRNIDCFSVYKFLELMFYPTVNAFAWWNTVNRWGTTSSPRNMHPHSCSIMWKKMQDRYYLGLKWILLTVTPGSPLSPLVPLMPGPPWDTGNTKNTHNQCLPIESLRRDMRLRNVPVQKYASIRPPFKHGNWGIKFWTFLKTEKCTVLWYDWIINMMDRGHDGRGWSAMEAIPLHSITPHL